MSRRVIVLQGVSGSGKSWHGRRLAEEARRTGLSVQVVSADSYFTRLGEGTYHFDPTKLPEAHAECFRSFLDALGLGTELIIVDNTNAKAIEISPYMLGAQAYGYEAEIHRVLCDPEVAAGRNIHEVPIGVVLKMHTRILDGLPPWWTLVLVDSDQPHAGAAP